MQDMATTATTSVVQVSNISPSATQEQIQTLFTFLGQLESLALYPAKPDPASPITKVAFIKFLEPSNVGVAQHLTNTVFVDRALICTPYDEGVIPDENVAMQFSGPANAPKSGLQASALPNVDPAKLDEIQRTIYVGNLDSKSVTAEQLMQFFASAGDVRYVRMAGDETQPTRFAFVEFASVQNVQTAIGMSGAVLGGRLIKVNHSNNAIVKPPGKKPDTQEISEAMRRVREAQSLISKALEPEKKPEKKEHSRKRSRSRSGSRSRRRKRSRSKDRSSRRKSRSRSRERRRKRSRSRSKDRSSRHRSRRSRSRSRDRRRKRSRSRSPRRSRRSRSRSRSKKKDSKRDRKESKRDRDDDRDRKKKSSRRGDDSDDERRKSKKSSKKSSSSDKKDAGSSSEKEDKKEKDSSDKEDKHENGDASKTEKEDAAPAPVEA